MALRGCPAKLKRYKDHCPVLFPYWMGKLLKNKDWIRDGTVTVPDINEDDFLPTLVVELPPPATTIAPIPEIPVV